MAGPGQKPAGRVSPLRRHMPVAGALVGGALLSLILCFVLRHLEESRVRETFHGVVSERQAALTAELAYAQDLLDSIQALSASGGRADADALRRLTLQAQARQPALISLDWLSLPQWQAQDLLPAGQVAELAAEGTVAATVLMPSAGESAVLVLTQPLFRGNASDLTTAEQRRARLAGLSQGRFRLSGLLERHGLDHERGVGIALYDSAEPLGNTVPPRRKAAAGEDLPDRRLYPLASQKLPDFERIDVLTLHQPLQLGNRTLDVLYYSLPGSYRPSRLGAILVLLGGLSLSVLLALYLHQSQNRRLAIERTVGQRTSELSGALRDLKESETRFRDFAMTASDWFWETDTDYRFTYLSKNLEEATGVRREDLIGRQRWEGLIPEEQLSEDKWLRHHDDILNRRPFRNFEYRLRNNAGTLIWVRIHGQPRFTDNGVFCGYRGIGTDITEEKAAQRRLMQLSRAVEQSSDAIVISDRGGKVEYVNPKFSEQTGFVRDEVLGQGADLWHRSAAARAAYEDCAGKMGAGHGWKGEFCNHRKDGTPYWVAVTLTPLRNDRNEITHYLTVQEDVTERKEFEQQLVDAKNAAEAGDRAKSEFLATMSHEIRTPMNGIIGMTGLLLDSPLSSEQQHFANTIRISAEALLTVLNDILDFSKMEAGRLDFEESPFELLPLVEGVVDILAPRINHRDVDLAHFVAGEARGVFIGDAGRLRQVLLNLAGNAVKFTARGNVMIEVSVDSSDEDDAVIRFVVSDTGVGIPETVKPRLFTMFTQADSTTARRYGGTGLGLAICRRIVEQMGGEIGFDSVEGKGSSFWFAIRLPRQPGHLIQTDAGAPLAGLRVLIVDDNTANREVFRRQIQRWGGYADDVESAMRGLDGVRQAIRQGHPYDILLLDHHMPGMTGLDLAAVVQADQNGGPLPAMILATSGGRGDLKQQARDMGVRVVLSKPVHERTLLDSLIVCAGRGSAQDIRPLDSDDDAENAQDGSLRLNILVAEDNTINQQVAVGLLAKLGHRADVANDGAEAVALVQRCDYDLVLMDMQMPRLDGVGATKAIRALPAPKSDVPVVAMTANAMQGDKDLCLQAGMDDYIAKPIDRRRLAELLDRWAARLARVNLPQLVAPDVQPALPDPSEPVLEDETRQDLIDSLGDETWQMLVRALRDSLISTLGAIHTALQSGQGDQAARDLHSLKGSALNLGFRRLGSRLSELEHCVKSGQGDPAAGFEVLGQAVEDTMHFIASELGL